MNIRLPEALEMFDKRFRMLFADFRIRYDAPDSAGPFRMDVYEPRGGILARFVYDPERSQPFGFLDPSGDICFENPAYDYGDPEELLHRLKKLAAACTMC